MYLPSNKILKLAVAFYMNYLRFQFLLPTLIVYMSKLIDFLD